MDRPDRSDHVSGCPGPAVLVEFVEALLPPARSREVRRHLAGCARCRREAADSEAMTDLLIARTETASRADGADLHEGLIERIECAITRIVTIPLEPLRAVGEGVRGTTVTARTDTRGRSMVFEGGGWFVQVRIDAGAPEDRVLRGRIAAGGKTGVDPGMPGIRVVLLDAAGIAGSTTPDRFGRFRIRLERAARPGPRTLKIWTSADTELVVRLPAAEAPGDRSG